ncbi:MAG: protein-L-isoaspartate(D-aspartate) O-methyltransferase [Planctomycetaceae bacterium]|nr:protein-L-isoaspartate(D-aspartate) O-methyltransferase [Planctomycetaceae bacterium]
MLVVLLAGGMAQSVQAQKARATEEEYRRRRLEMVSKYLAPEGITDPLVLKAARTVRRHEFVRNTDKDRAYIDGAWPIGYKQTISPPFVVAYMTQTLNPQPEDRVLEIGTGSGYQAAILGEIVKEVYTIEIVEPLGRSAARRLQDLGYTNISTRIGDGYKGWPEHAPFDKIIVTCSPESVPEPLVEQLKEGGRMIIPLGERYEQVFHLFEKKNGKLESKKLISTLFVPMTGISEEKRTIQPDPLNPSVNNGSFEDDENEDGRTDGWHYQRLVTLMNEGAPAGKRFLRMENDEPGRYSQLLQGVPIDGRQVHALRVSLMRRYVATERGTESYQLPGVLIHFYDSARRPIPQNGAIGPWLGTKDEWERELVSIRVPPNARESVIRIGLNGATGTLDVDDLSIRAVRDR